METGEGWELGFYRGVTLEIFPACIERAMSFQLHGFSGDRRERGTSDSMYVVRPCS